MELSRTGNFDPNKDKLNPVNTKSSNSNNGAQSNDFSQDSNRGKWKNDTKKYISLLFIIFFLLSLCGSILIFCYITFTNKFNEGIVENLILKNGSKALEWWIDSPIQPLIKVHVFNFTNVDEVMRDPRNVKIKLKDVGPYIFKEYSQKINLEFHDDYKITFQDNKSLIFDEQRSVGRLDDMFYVPNIPLLAALKIANKKNSFEQIAFNTILTASDPKEFHSRKVSEFLFGYSDTFIAMTPGISADRVGIIGGREGISKDKMTIGTGEDSLDNLNRIYAMNGKEKLDIWKTDECNDINGTDGSQFAPHMMDVDKDLKIFIKSFCRTITLRYERETFVLNGIPAWRYKTPIGEFSSSNPSMTCHCDYENEKCSPDGIFDASECNEGIPLLISYPHFMEANESSKYFEGLAPVREKHETYADIHPRMAFPIGGASRLQINMKVTSRKIGMFGGKTFFKNFPEDMILPIIWFEVTAGEIPAEFQSIVFHTTQSANATYFAIQYGSLIGAIFSFVVLLILTTHFCFMKKTIKKTTVNQSKNVEFNATYTNIIYPQIPTADHH